MNRFEQDLKFEHFTRQYCEYVLVNYFDAKDVVWTDGNILDTQFDIDCFVVLQNGRRIGVSCKTHRPRYWDYRSRVTQEYYTRTETPEGDIEGPWFKGIASVYLELYFSGTFVEWWLIDLLRVKMAKNLNWCYQTNAKHGSATFKHMNGYDLLDQEGCVLEHGTLRVAGDRVPQDDN